MFLSLFKGYRQARLQAIKASLPDFLVTGEGEYFSFSRTPLGVPILRLYRNANDAGTNEPEPHRLLSNEIPELPADFPPWVPNSLVQSEGPFLVGHRYRRRSVRGRSKHWPAYAEILDLRFVSFESPDGYMFEVIEDNSKVVDKDPEGQPPLKLKKPGARLETFMGLRDLSNFSYIGPPEGAPLPGSSVKPTPSSHLD